MSISIHARSRKAIVTGAAFLAAGALVLSGCASSGDAPAPEESKEPVVPGDGTTADGMLRVGTVLPITGSLAFLGPPEFAGVDLAEQEINEYFATLTEAPFEVSVEHRDSGDGETDIATNSASELIDLDTDVVVGAASSGVSFQFIDQLIAAGVVQISPANTSPDFTTYEDGDFYWRTAPSDVIQGDALANHILASGGTTLGIIYVNDAYGEGLAKYTSEPFEAAGGTVAAQVAYNLNETSFQSQIDEVLSAGVDSIAIIGFQESLTMLPILLNNEGIDPSSVYLVDGNLSNFGTDIDVQAEGMSGTLPGNPAAGDFRDRLLAVDPELQDFSYAAESYDAVILSALAAMQGGDDASVTIRDNLQSVSEGGTKCATFAECAALLEAGTDIDYDGASGPIEFDENGDPTRAMVGIYRYGADNTYTLETTVEGSL
ncbi:ABC transporter substrate-binding protein [Arenivirga flava]|uniref:Branched-chain amino acid ABC transporter substrate-binding protein n=1 Tax=Arenivirga flava TaxID=1930060 RepID=A0AA37X937_9MICO|nr:ABC transporter substrate-binding protein [Arenivirga flava]GMA28169.1 branched-chain amino acid ABC transporter substrate-binding protein [Arenivirga flava]